MAEQPKWYAVFTAPQNEKSVARHLEMREVEAFLPTYAEERVWKNRQRVKLVLPLFPTYIFVRMVPCDRLRVLQTPGVVRIVGNAREPISLPDAEIEFLRSDHCIQHVRPFHDLVVGQRVRMRSGILQGVEGVLVRKNSGSRFVITLGLINQHAAVEVNAQDLEPVDVMATPRGTERAAG
jgi:transcription antitermination factor NusG